MSAPIFVWGYVDGDSFVHSVSCCYDEVIHWQKNLIFLGFCLERVVEL